MSTPTENLYHSAYQYWQRLSTQYELDLSSSDLSWFASVAVVAAEIRELLVRQGSLIRDAASGWPESGDWRDAVRWDVQEPLLRLISLRKNGASWVTMLDVLEDCGPRNQNMLPATMDWVETIDALRDALVDLERLAVGDPCDPVICATLRRIFILGTRTLSLTVMT
ncbi:MAG TPA: hypothetical protein VN428_14130 [Bryobacteraceae bacterium]|nr:hypothetical protein [Bryobacteraceae bacterium]